MKLPLMIFEATIYATLAIVFFCMIDDAETARQAALFGIMFACFLLLTGNVLSRVEAYIRNKKK